MKSPNETPNFPRSVALKLVSAGLQRLPGLSVFEKPSKRMTATIKSVDMRPKMDAYDKTDKGIRAVGIKLKRVVHEQRPIRMD